MPSDRLQTNTATQLEDIGSILSQNIPAPSPNMGAKNVSYSPQQTAAQQMAKSSTDFSGITAALNQIMQSLQTLSTSVGTLSSARTTPSLGIGAFKDPNSHLLGIGEFSDANPPPSSAKYNLFPPDQSVSGAMTWNSAASQNTVAAEPVGGWTPLPNPSNAEAYRRSVSMTPSVSNITPGQLGERFTSTPPAPQPQAQAQVQANFNTPLNQAVPAMGQAAVVPTTFDQGMASYQKTNTPTNAPTLAYDDYLVKPPPVYPSAPSQQMLITSEERAAAATAASNENKPAPWVQKPAELTTDVMPLANWSDINLWKEAPVGGGGRGSENAKIGMQRELTPGESEETNTYMDWVSSGGSGYNRTDPNLQFTLQPGKMADTLSTVAQSLVSPEYTGYWGDRQARVTPEIQDMIDSGKEADFAKAMEIVVPEIGTAVKENPAPFNDIDALQTSVNKQIMPVGIESMSSQERADRESSYQVASKGFMDLNMSQVALQTQEKEYNKKWGNYNETTMTQPNGFPMTTAMQTEMASDKSAITTRIADQASSMSLWSNVGAKYEQRNAELTGGLKTQAMERLSEKYPGIDWVSGGAEDITKKASYAKSYLSGETEDWAKTAAKSGTGNLLTSSADELKTLKQDMLKSELELKPVLNESELSSVTSRAASIIKGLNAGGFATPDFSKQFASQQMAMQNQEAIKADYKQRGAAFVGQPLDTYNEVMAANKVSLPTFLEQLSTVATAAETASAQQAQVRSDEMLSFDLPVSLDLKKIEGAQIRGDTAEEAKLTTGAISHIEAAQVKLAEQYKVAEKDYLVNKTYEGQQGLYDMQNKMATYENLQDQLRKESGQYMNPGTSLPSELFVGYPADLQRRGITWDPSNISTDTSIDKQPDLIPSFIPPPTPSGDNKKPVPGSPGTVPVSPPTTSPTTPFLVPSGNVGTPGVPGVPASGTGPISIPTVGPATPTTTEPSSGILTKGSVLVNVTMTNNINISAAAGASSVNQSLGNFGGTMMSVIAGATT